MQQQSSKAGKRKRIEEIKCIHVHQYISNTIKCSSNGCFESNIKEKKPSNIICWSNKFPKSSYLCTIDCVYGSVSVCGTEEKKEQFDVWFAHVPKIILYSSIFVFPIGPADNDDRTRNSMICFFQWYFLAYLHMITFFMLYIRIRFDPEDAVWRRHIYFSLSWKHLFMPPTLCGSYA